MNNIEWKMTKIITLGEYASMIQKNITWVSLCLIKFSFKNRKEYNTNDRSINMKEKYDKKRFTFYDLITFNRIFARKTNLF